MKRLDRLVMKELVGPWFFGVAMFTVLIVASSFLFKLTDFLVQGVSFMTVLELGLLMTPAIFVKTFAMAMLLAGLLGFGRLSGDSEIIALRAAGTSIVRIVVPVGLMALLVAGLAFGFGETLVPWSQARSSKLAADIGAKLNPKSLHIMSQPIVVKGETVGAVVAQSYDQVRQVLIGATVIGYTKDGGVKGYLHADQLYFDPGQLSKGVGWRVQGVAVYESFDGTQRIYLTDAWPEGMPTVNFTPKDILASLLNDPDLLSMSELGRQIRALRLSAGHDPEQLLNLQFFYWNKIALPLATFVYGILGAPLGIRRTRTSAAAGFAIAVALIFAYFTLINLLNVYAKGGLIPPIVASFAPIIVGCIAAIAIIRRRDF